MSNARLDVIFDQYIQNMIDASGEDAVNRARDLLKENDLLWWDYWDYQDYGHLTRDDALSVFQEVDRILNKSTKKSKATTKSFNDMVKSQRNKNCVQKSGVPNIDVYSEDARREVARILMDFDAIGPWELISEMKRLNNEIAQWLTNQ